MRRNEGKQLRATVVGRKALVVTNEEQCSRGRQGHADVQRETWVGPGRVGVGWQVSSEWYRDRESQRVDSGDGGVA